MDQVKIRASVAAHGLVKGAEVTVAATPTVEGAIKSGVFVELERVTPEPELPLDDAVEPTEGDKPAGTRTRGKS